MVKRLNKEINTNYTYTFNGYENSLLTNILYYITEVDSLPKTEKEILKEILDAFQDD